jgi:hemolysin type calcium-binding protein
MVSLRADRRLAGVVCASAAAVLALAAATWAEPDMSSRVSRLVKGTNGNDLLRGSRSGDILEGLGGNDRLYGRAGADRLYGGAGNDRLFGGPGDDKLAGGPGTDRISCGRGRDVVYTTAAGGVSRDCEIVHRGATPVPSLSGGTYRGDSVSFQLAPDLKTISHLEIDFDGQCPAGTTTRIQIARSGPFAVQTDKTFSLDEQEADGDKVKLSGAIQNGGQATGTFELQTATCDTGSVTWTATRRG